MTEQLQIELPPDLRTALAQAYARLGKDEPMAVRSFASGKVKAAARWGPSSSRARGRVVRIELDRGEIQRELSEP